MAWVSPKVYAILKNSEEGKDILEGIAEKDQAEVDKEVDEFFSKGGKGYKSNNEYPQDEFIKSQKMNKQEFIDKLINEKGWDKEEAKHHADLQYGGDENFENDLKEKKLKRFSKEPKSADYGIDDDLREQLRDYEYYSRINDFNKAIQHEEKWRQERANSRWTDKADLDKMDKRIAMLKNPAIQKYVNDRNSFNKQADEDFNSFKEEAKQRYLEKILGDNDLYSYDFSDDYSKDRDDLFDDINKEFNNRYGYEERLGRRDKFSPLRDNAFTNYFETEERVNDETGKYKKKKYNKNKIIGDLLSGGIITYDDLKNFLKGKK